MAYTCKYKMKMPHIHSGGSTQGLRGAKPPKSEKKKDLAPPKFQGWYIIFFAGVLTLTELTGSAVAIYEANEATASVKFVASVTI